jgi:DNA-binding response OmpR family regulator
MTEIADGHDSLTILIAEDDPGISSIIRFVLEDEGFSVVMARDGSEAVRLARELRPALILLDVVLPMKDGREVIASLREEMGSERPSIVLLSASSKLSELAAELGVEGYITKPFEPEDIVLVTRQHTNA